LNQYKYEFEKYLTANIVCRNARTEIVGSNKNF